VRQDLKPDEGSGNAGTLRRKGSPAGRRRVKPGFAKSPRATAGLADPTDDIPTIKHSWPSDSRRSSPTIKADGGEAECSVKQLARKDEGVPIAAGGWSSPAQAINSTNNQRGQVTPRRSTTLSRMPAGSRPCSRHQVRRCGHRAAKVVVLMPRRAYLGAGTDEHQVINQVSILLPIYRRRRERTGVEAGCPGRLPTGDHHLNFLPPRG